MQERKNSFPGLLFMVLMCLTLGYLAFKGIEYGNANNPYRQPEWGAAVTPVADLPPGIEYQSDRPLRRGVPVGTIHINGQVYGVWTIPADANK